MKVGKIKSYHIIKKSWRLWRENNSGKWVRSLIDYFECVCQRVIYVYPLWFLFQE